MVKNQKGGKKMRINLYVHYDSVTSHIMTRGINLMPTDFDAKYVPNNMILAEAPSNFGKYDVRTNFKILRGKPEVLEYLNYCRKEKVRVSNWMDFESVSMMHQLTPNEIAEILYLFHANQTLRSAFFYKLQNNYAFLTLPNGLIKTYYRYSQHFNLRFQRVLQEQMQILLNEGCSFFFKKKEIAKPVPEAIVEQIAPLFTKGLKIDFAQAYDTAGQWFVPLFIIEDELTLLTSNQSQTDQVGQLVYNYQEKIWQVELNSN